MTFQPNSIRTLQSMKASTEFDELKEENKTSDALNNNESLDDEDDLEKLYDVLEKNDSSMNNSKFFLTNKEKNKLKADLKIDVEEEDGG